MILKLHPTDLRRRLTKTGPFIVFCNAECGGDNEKLIEYIYDISYSLNDISFIELKWIEYKKFKGFKSDDEKNHIYAYFKGEISLFEPNPNNENLLIFFNKCVELYNKKIDTTVQNIGLRNKNVDKCIKNKKEQLERERNYVYKKAYFLRKKIKISSINTKNIKNNILFQPQMKYYNDVKYTELPNSLFDENPISDNSIITENNIKKSENKTVNISYNIENIFKNDDIYNNVYMNYKSTGMSASQYFKKCIKNEGIN